MAGWLCRAFYDRSLAISIREYSPYLVAEVTVEGEDLKDASSKGFKQVQTAASRLSTVTFACS